MHLVWLVTTTLFAGDVDSESLRKPAKLQPAAGIQNPRPLAVAISTDQGKTFPCRKNIAEGPGSFAYPSALQTADGRLLVVFTSEERTVINLAAFEENAVCGAK